MLCSRRVFLQRTSAAAAAGLLTQLPAKRLWALAPAELLPEPDEALMRQLAHVAMETARSAGASFADMRLIVGRSISIGGGFRRSSGDKPLMGRPSLTLTSHYGIRAIVDGAWGTASGHVLTTEAVVVVARTAVAQARANRPRRLRVLELAPTPRVENGLWATPMERDPLTVPLGEQRDLILAALGEVTSNPAISRAGISFGWRRPTTLFASTDGTLILQRLCTAVPGGSASARAGEEIWGEVDASIESLRLGPYGYEAVGAATLGSELRQAAERAIALAQAARAPTPVEVGRYDLVFGPTAVAHLLQGVAGAVHLEYALGYMANGAGISFAAPPAEILGRYQVGAPFLTVHADRSQPRGAATVGWDDEGVKPQNYTFIQDGVITDYHTTRQTAVELADWYRAQGRPVRAHGCTREAGSTMPSIRLPNLTMEPSPDHTTLEDLIAGTQRGFYLEDAGAQADQQGLNAQGAVPHTAVREIRHGKLGNYVRDFAFQFITPEFWKRADGLGGVASAVSQSVITDMGALQDSLQPFPFSTMRTVPMRVPEVNVLNTGRMA